MATLEEVYLRLKQQEARIKKLERLVKESGIKQQEESNKVEDTEVKARVKKKEPSYLSKLSFIQVITFLGILGIIIGLVSFFFYAVANHWIGETAQVMIGILVGFVLFGFAYFLRSKNENWSNIVFGGSYFIGFLSIGVGVLRYKVMPDYLGIIICILFLISSTLMSILFKSRAIGYFTLVGGYLVPFITGTHQYNLFILSYFTFISLSLVLLSFKENWTDLRFTSFIIIAIFLLSQAGEFSRAENVFIPLTFLVIFFLLYNIASVISSARKISKKFSAFDSIIIVAFAVLFAGLIRNIYDWTGTVFGIFLMLFSLIYFAEIFLFKALNIKIDSSVIYSLLATGVVTLNTGLYFIINKVNLDYLIIMFMVEYVLFSVISAKSKGDNIYHVFSILSLVLTAILFIQLRFNHGLVHATFFMFVYFSFIISFFILFRKNINFTANVVGFIIGTFLFLYSAHKYIAFFIESNEVNQIILSIMWLIYSLVLYNKVDKKEGEWLALALIGITVVKIAFNDLFFLEGVYRIIGFIIFGVLLLIGGYFLHRRKDGKV